MSFTYNSKIGLAQLPPLLHALYQTRQAQMDQAQSRSSRRLLSPLQQFHPVDEALFYYQNDRCAMTSAIVHTKLESEVGRPIRSVDELLAVFTDEAPRFVMAPMMTPVDRYTGETDMVVCLIDRAARKITVIDSKPEVAGRADFLAPSTESRFECEVVFAGTQALTDLNYGSHHALQTLEVCIEDIIRLPEGDPLDVAAMRAKVQSFSQQHVDLPAYCQNLSTLMQEADISLAKSGTCSSISDVRTVIWQAACALQECTAKIRDTHLQYACADAALGTYNALALAVLTAVPKCYGDDAAVIVAAQQTLKAMQYDHAVGPMGSFKQFFSKVLPVLEQLNRANMTRRRISLRAEDGKRVPPTFAQFDEFLQAVEAIVHNDAFYHQDKCELFHQLEDVSFQQKTEGSWYKQLQEVIKAIVIIDVARDFSRLMTGSGLFQERAKAKAFMDANANVLLHSHPMQVLGAPLGNIPFFYGNILLAVRESIKSVEKALEFASPPDEAASLQDYHRRLTQLSLRLQEIVGLYNLRQESASYQEAEAQMRRVHLWSEPREAQLKAAQQDDAKSEADTERLGTSAEGTLDSPPSGTSAQLELRDGDTRAQLEQQQREHIAANEAKEQQLRELQASLEAREAAAQEYAEKQEAWFNEWQLTVVQTEQKHQQQLAASQAQVTELTEELRTTRYTASGNYQARLALQKELAREGAQIELLQQPIQHSLTGMQKFRLFTPVVAATATVIVAPIALLIVLGAAHVAITLSPVIIALLALAAVVALAVAIKGCQATQPASISVSRPCTI